MNTLPCAKLRAIVEAAREISRLYEEEQKERHQQQRVEVDNHSGGDMNKEVFETAAEGNHRLTRELTGEADNGNESAKEHLGADDFLPIFIFCVVQAQMERPCALCK